MCLFRSKQVRLHLLDCFLLEGVKVLFRFSIALLELEKESLVRTLRGDEHMSTGETINLIRKRAAVCHDIIELKQIAFGQIKIPRRSYLSTRRAFYLKQINSQPASSNFQLAATESSTVHWIRKSSEILGLTSPSPPSKQQPTRVVFSNDRSKVAWCRPSSGNQSKEIELLHLFSCHDLPVPTATASGTHTLAVGGHSRNSMLVGVANDGSKLIFCQNGNKFSVNNLINGNTLAMASVLQVLVTLPFDLLDCFYHEAHDQLVAIGRNGVITRLGVSCCEHKTETSTETAHLCGKRNLQLTTAAMDIEGALLYLLFADGLPEGYSQQLFVVDAVSLDVFNCIDLGCEPICRVFPFSGLVFVVRNRGNDGNSVVSLTTPLFSRQLLSESEGPVSDLQTFDGARDTACSKDRTLIVVALFNSGKLVAIETKNNCILSRRAAHVADAADAGETVIVGVHVDGEEMSVALVHTCSVQKLSIVKM